MFPVESSGSNQQLIDACSCTVSVLSSLGGVTYPPQRLFFVGRNVSSLRNSEEKKNQCQKNSVEKQIHVQKKCLRSPLYTCRWRYLFQLAQLHLLIGTVLFTYWHNFIYLLAQFHYLIGIVWWAPRIVRNMRNQQLRCSIWILDDIPRYLSIMLVEC